MIERLRPAEHAADASTRSLFMEQQMQPLLSSDMPSAGRDDQVIVDADLAELVDHNGDLQPARFDRNG